MSIADFFKGLFGKKERFSLSDDIDIAFATKTAQETAIRELALNVAAGMIAATVSNCEFKTYSKGEILKGREHYLWNVKPNANESSAEFIQKWVYTLCMNGEALIVFDKPLGSGDMQAFVADTFAVKREFALYPAIYSDVTTGNFTFNRDFSADDVLYCKLNNTDVKKLIDQYYEGYKKLIDMAYKAFSKSRGERGVLETIRAPGDTDYEAEVRKIMDKLFKPYFANDSAVLPLFDGQKYTRVNGNGQREFGEAGDVTKLIGDVFNMTALAFRIPPALMRGEMADISQLMMCYLTFCIDPLCGLLSNEITAKRYSRDDYIAGDYLEIDTSNVQHRDLLDAATAIDKLIASGAFSINDVREALGVAKIDEPWADQHYITKNYGDIEDALGAAAQ
ncbi:MAG: phage portal protein [Defluviitaleaceae bacterium]|nr:phage portal protein [Defluviitaleaceae bacterium]